MISATKNFGFGFQENQGTGRNSPNSFPDHMYEEWIDCFGITRRALIIEEICVDEQGNTFLRREDPYEREMQEMMDMTDWLNDYVFEDGRRMVTNPHSENYLHKN